jgi:hypothetical protein
MAQKQTAVIVVNKEWVSGSVAHLINDGHPSRSTGLTHLIIGRFEETTNQGVWISGVTTTRLTPDQSPITMKLMIPWFVIQTLGIIDDPQGKVSPGYHADDAASNLG